MATDDRLVAKPRRSLTTVVVVALGVAAALVVLALPSIQTPSKRPLPPAIKKLREIESAMAEYRHKNGHLPHDERGQEFALYQLHPFVSADAFHLIDDEGQTPYWDHNAQQLRGGDVIYVNQPLADSMESQLFLIAKPKSNANWTYAAYTGFGPHSAEYAATPDEHVLGSFRTVDDFHVSGSELFQDLAATHVVYGSPWTTTGNSEQGLVSASVAGRSMKYQFHEGRLTHCTITTQQGTVIETFTTDKFGQITGVNRVPDNWRKILGIDAK